MSSRTNRATRIAMYIGCYLANEKLGEELFKDLPDGDMDLLMEAIESIAHDGYMQVEGGAFIVEYVDAPAKHVRK